MAPRFTRALRAAFLLSIVCLWFAPAPAAAQEFPEERVDRLEVSPASVTVQAGERVPVEIAALDADGAALEDVRMRVSARGSGAWYDPETSEIVGLLPGEELVVARVRRAKTEGPGFDDVLAFVEVKVLPGAVDRIEVEPAEATLYPESRLELRATPFAGDIEREDADVTWSSADPDVVRTTPGGLAVGVSPGEARLTARSEEATTSVAVRVVDNPVETLEVTPAAAEARVGDVVRLAAIARGADGGEVPGAPLTWTLLADPGAAYLGGDGAFVAYEPGVHRVAASAGARTVYVEITATRRPPRHGVRLLAHGTVPSGQATTDLWVFEGLDGGDYVYTGTYSGNLMYAWDVSDPENPVITDSLAFDGRRVNDVKINADASHAVVTSENASNRRNGITILDLADPAHPERITHFTDGLTGGVHNVWIEGDLVYAVHYGTADLHIIDISDPAVPRRVGRWGLENPDRWLHDVSIVDGLAYLSYWDDGVVILDVGAGIAGGTPTEPELVSRYAYKYRLGNDDETYGNTHHAIRYGDYLFTGDEIFGCAECINGPRGYIHVLDVSDIENPAEVAHYRVPEAGAHNMWAEDGKLYVGYYQGGLRVVDISGELRGDLYAQDREIAWYMTEDDEGTVPHSTNTWGAQPYEGAVYASDGNSGLWVVKLVPPEGEPVF